MVPETHKVTCNQVTCVPVQKPSTRCESHMVPETHKVTYNQVTCVPVQKPSTRCESHMVPVTHDVEVTLCSMVNKTVKQTVHYCEMEAYTTTVKVPVGTPCGGCGGCGGCH
jgi:hypothetical protein